MSLGLRPAILDDACVPEALQWYVEEVMGQVPPKVELDMDESLQRLPSVVEFAFYRIAQEALNNVARHARASKAVVFVKKGADVVEPRYRTTAWASSRTILCGAAETTWASLLS